jgi:hypothetical protein
MWSITRTSRVCVGPEGHRVVEAVQLIKLGLMGHITAVAAGVSVAK